VVPPETAPRAVAGLHQKFREERAGFSAAGTADNQKCLKNPEINHKYVQLFMRFPDCLPVFWPATGNPANKSQILI